MIASQLHDSRPRLLTLAIAAASSVMSRFAANLALVTRREKTTLAPVLSRTPPLHFFSIRSARHAHAPYTSASLALIVLCPSRRACAHRCLSGGEGGRHADCLSVQPWPCESWSCPFAVPQPLTWSLVRPFLFATSHSPEMSRVATSTDI
jgi:hypothetical protein